MVTSNASKKTIWSLKMLQTSEEFGYMVRLGLVNPSMLGHITPITIPSYAINGGMVTKVRRTLSWMTSAKSIECSVNNSKYGQTDMAAS